MARKKISRVLAYDPKSGMYKGKTDTTRRNSDSTQDRKIPRERALKIARPVDGNGRIRKDVG